MKHLLSKDDVIRSLESGGRDPLNNKRIQPMHFYNEVFPYDVDFTGAIFTGEVIFNNAEFKKNAIFDNVRFEDIARFSAARFRGNTSFIGARFLKYVFFDNINKPEVNKKTEDNANANGGFFDFQYVIFEQKVDFSKTIFPATVDFKYAKFYEESEFEEVEFKGVVMFNRAEFLREVKFIKTSFLNNEKKHDVNFSEAFFGERAIFEGLANKRIFDGNRFVLFQEDILGRLGGVKFIRANLTKCSFIDTDVSKVEFTNVQWDKKRYFIFWERNIIYDELKLIENKNYKECPEVEKVYRQLRINYEKDGNYRDAGDFHIGEMEMRRLAMGRWKVGNKLLQRFLNAWGWIYQNCFSLTVWYKWFSGYGENHWLALSWLVCLVFLLFPILYINNGFESNFYFAILHSLEISTLQQASINITSHWGRFFEILQRIFVPSLLTLFLLALGRRFKR
jgi:uncharacterized protein YjbI with pentapeptide repeats